MENITMNVKNNKLMIEIDLKAKRRPSASGKTEVIASTQGNVSIPDHPEIKLGVNCYTK